MIKLRWSTKCYQLYPDDSSIIGLIMADCEEAMVHKQNYLNVKTLLFSNSYNTLCIMRETSQQITTLIVMPQSSCPFSTKSNSCLISSLLWAQLPWWIIGPAWHMIPNNTTLDPIPKHLLSLSSNDWDFGGAVFRPAVYQRLSLDFCPFLLQIICQDQFKHTDPLLCG